MSKQQSAVSDQQVEISLEDCVQLYLCESKKREDDRKSEELRNRVAQEVHTWSVLKEIGLTPKRVEGKNVYFDYGGDEVHFVLLNWKHGLTGFYRVLEKCPKCDNSFITNSYNFEKENIGAVLASPEDNRAFHDCPNWMADEEKPEEKPMTTAQKLLAALDEYIREQAYRDVE